MPLYSNPPHQITLLSVTSGSDAGAGVSLSYSTAQAAIPASVNTASASEVERFAAMQIEVTHVIAVLSSALSVTPARGWKATDDNTGATYHVEGIRAGQAYGRVPAFHHFSVRQLL